MPDEGTCYPYDKPPDHCPRCHHGIKAIRIGSNLAQGRTVDGGNVLQILYRCPRDECQLAFIATFWQNRSYTTHYPEGNYLLRNTAPYSAEEPDTPAEIKELSAHYHSDEQIKPTPDEGPRAEARYRLSELQLGEECRKGDLKDRVNFFLTTGKRILQVDGHHIHHVFLIDRKNNLTSIITPQFATYSEKPLIWAEIAKRAKKEKASENRCATSVERAF